MLIKYVCTEIYFNIQLQSGNEPTPVHFDKVLCADLIDLGNARKTHGQPDFITQDPQTEFDTLLATICQAPKNGSSDPYKVCTESERLEDVGTVSNTSVNMDGNLLLHSRNDFRESIKRSQRTICQKGQ